MTKLADLEAKVALMRRLGVLSWDGIVLGPPPPPPAKMPKRKKDEDEETTAQRGKREFYEDLMMRNLTPEELDQLPEQ